MNKNCFMFWVLQSVNTYEFKHYYFCGKDVDKSEASNPKKALAFHHKKNAKKFLKENNMLDKYEAVIIEFHTDKDEIPNKYIDEQ